MIDIHIVHYFEAKKPSQSFILHSLLPYIWTEAVPRLPLTEPDPSHFNSENISVPKILASKPGDNN